MAVIMIAKRNEHHAINFAKFDLPKFEIIPDYVVYSEFPSNAVRF